jgi:NifU-like protein
MWNYSETVKDHFFNPRNAGEVADANAVGEVGSLSCGDALKLTMKVDPETEIIEQAGFQTFGCGSAIASSSALTTLITGKTLDAALQITNQDIADFLGGLPAEKMHCSVMGREALEAAVANFRGEEVDHHEEDEGALICKCFAVDEAKIRKAVMENGLRDVEGVTNYTKAGGACSCCHEKIEQVLEACLEELSAKPAIAAEETTDELVIITRVINRCRPRLQADGGDVQLLSVDGKMVYVSLTGSCAGCMMTGATLAWLQQQLIEALGHFVHLEAIPAKPTAAVQPVKEA